MIDKDTLRIARRTVERNGYTVLPPRDRDERDLSRFRTRREVEKEGKDDYRPTRQAPRFRDTVEDEQPRRFKPLRQREFDKDDYEPRRTARPTRREMNDDEKLGAAIRTAEENGFTIRKMSKLDQAKQVARDNGFEVRRVGDEDAPRRPTRRPVEAPVDGGNDRPARVLRPLVRPKANTTVNDGIRTRTAPDTEIKGNVVNTATKTQEPAPTEPQKKPTYADDFMDRAARFFGEDE